MTAPEVESSPQHIFQTELPVTACKESSGEGTLAYVTEKYLINTNWKAEVKIPVPDLSYLISETFSSRKCNKPLRLVVGTKKTKSLIAAGMWSTTILYFKEKLTTSGEDEITTSDEIIQISNHLFDTISMCYGHLFEQAATTFSPTKLRSKTYSRLDRLYTAYPDVVAQIMFRCAQEIFPNSREVGTNGFRSYITTKIHYWMTGLSCGTNLALQWGKFKNKQSTKTELIHSEVAQNLLKAIEGGTMQPVLNINQNSEEDVSEDQTSINKETEQTKPSDRSRWFEVGRIVSREVATVSGRQQFLKENSSRISIAGPSPVMRRYFQLKHIRPLGGRPPGTIISGAQKSFKTLQRSDTETNLINSRYQKLAAPLVLESTRIVEEDKDMCKKLQRQVGVDRTSYNKLRSKLEGRNRTGLRKLQQIRFRAKTVEKQKQQKAEQAKRNRQDKNLKKLKDDITDKNINDFFTSFDKEDSCYSSSWEEESDSNGLENSENISSELLTKLVTVSPQTVSTSISQALSNNHLPLISCSYNGQVELSPVFQPSPPPQRDSANYNSRTPLFEPLPPLTRSLHKWKRGGRVENFDNATSVNVAAVVEGSDDEDQFVPHPHPHPHPPTIVNHRDNTRTTFRSLPESPNSSDYQSEMSMARTNRRKSSAISFIEAARRESIRAIIEVEQFEDFGLVSNTTKADLFQHFNQRSCSTRRSSRSHTRLTSIDNLRDVCMKVYSEVKKRRRESESFT